MKNCKIDVMGLVIFVLSGILGMGIIFGVNYLAYAIYMTNGLTVFSFFWTTGTLLIDLLIVKDMTE